jgi:RimJ/RimL family protein N-acetyltransferase
MRLLTQDSKGSPSLLGEVVELRSFTQEHLTESYLGWLRDPQLMRYSNQRFRTHTMDTCRAYLDSFVGTNNLFMAIHHEDEFVGTITAYRSSEHGTANVGLLIGAGAQGKGLGKDAWATLLAHLLSTGTRKVTGGTLRINVAMVRIMQSCGMKPDGIRVGQELVDGVAHDILHFAKFARP